MHRTSIRPAAVAWNAHLVAVLVAPRCQALQGLLFGFGAALHYVKFTEDAQCGRHGHARFHAAGQRCRVAIDEPFAPSDEAADGNRRFPGALPTGETVQGQVRKTNGEPNGLGRVPTYRAGRF